VREKPYIVGNWKMNQLNADIESFFKVLGNSNLPENSHAWLAPQFIHIPSVQAHGGKLGVKVGSQNCSKEDKGAFTGDTSALSLKDLGVDFTLLGHSERRAIFNEDNNLLNEKLHNALKNNLTVIFCIGETLEEREKGMTNEVLTKQLEEGLKGLESQHHSKILLAYEPVWAIGTGKTATPQEAQDTHSFIRSTMGKSFDFSSDKLVILYGGSVKPANIAGLISMQDIDGALVGGASLKGEDFLALLENSVV
jgi:triosephosphate isomerase